MINPLCRCLVLVIRIYQITISPYFINSCRYQPSCSNYAIIALSKYGIMRGLYLTFKRIMRCHPYGGSGYDPVP